MEKDLRRLPPAAEWAVAQLRRACLHGSPQIAGGGGNSDD